MSRTILIPAMASLIDEVCIRLESSGSDYSGNIVVFPGKRPAHFLRAAIAAREGRSFIPPQIFSIDEFVDLLYAVLPDVPRRDVHPFDAVVVLHDLHRKLREKIGAGKFDEFDAFLPLGLRMFEEFEELRMACLPDRAVEAALLGIPLRGVHVLAGLFAEFYGRIEALGRSTRATRYVTVSESFSGELPGGGNQLLFAGFYALTRAETRLMDHLRSLDHATFIFQDGPGLMRRLNDPGITPERSEVESVAPEVSVYSAPDTHGEIFALSTLLKNAAGRNGVIDRDSVVVVPDPSAIPALVHHALSAVPEYNISIGYPHSRTPVLGFLTGLMDLVATMHEGKLQAREYLKFILHPYTKNVLFGNRADVTRILFQTTEDLFLRKALPPFVTLEELENSDGLFDRVSRRIGEPEITSERLAAHLRQIHDHTIRKLLDPPDIGSCAVACMDILSFLSKRSTARRHPFFRRYAESIVESLVEVRRSLMAGTTPGDTATIFRIVRNCLLEGKVALPGTPLRGLQVLGLLETRNLRFENVYLLNANEDLLPGAGGRYRLVPDGVRARLGLATVRDRDEVVEYYFHLLIAGAKQVHLFFTENESKEASRFVEKILWEKAQKKGDAKPHTIVTGIRYETKLTHALPGKIPKPSGFSGAAASFEFSASSLDTYLKCGLRFYYRYVLSLEERDEVSGDIDRTDLGLFVHRVLADFCAPFVGKSVGGTDLKEGDLDAQIDAHFARMFGREQLGNHYLMKIQVSEQLKRYLGKWEVPRLNGAPAEILGVEEKLSVTDGGYRFVGRIDRVERRLGRIRIWDFKTSGDSRKLSIRPDELVMDDRSTWESAIGSLQLPFYAFLYHKVKNIDVAEIFPSYFLLGKESLNKEGELPLYKDGTDQRELYRRLEEVMFGLIHEIVDERVPFNPPRDVKENCPWCPYASLCGTSWVKRKF